MELADQTIVVDEHGTLATALAVHHQVLVIGSEVEILYIKAKRFAPSHLRAHPNPAKTLTLLAALLHTRESEITDTLVELLIATVHRINARAERRVTSTPAAQAVAIVPQVRGRRLTAAPRHPPLRGKNTRVSAAWPRRH